MNRGEREAYSSLEAEVERLRPLEEQVAELTEVNANLKDQLRRLIKTSELNQNTLASNREIIDGQRLELEHWMGADAVTATVKAQIDRIEGSGETIISAREIAADTAVKELATRITAEQANQLISGARREARREFGPDRIQEIRDEQDKIFTGDGTYTRIAEDVEATVYDEITAELVASKRQEIRDELNKPEKRAAVIARRTAELEASGELTEYANAQASELEAVWEIEAEGQAYKAIDDEVEADHDGFVAQHATQWRESWDGRDYKEKAQNKAEQQWEDATEEKVAEAINDEVLNELLQNKASRIKESLLAEENIGKILEAFRNGRVTIDSITEGTKILLRFGIFTDGDWNYSTNQHNKNLVCYRRIEVVSVGEGKFVIRADSLNSSDNPYEKAMSYTAGEVVEFGTKKIDDGSTTLTPDLQPDMPLSIKRGTNGQHANDVLHPLADILINDVSARKDKDFVLLVDAPKK